MLNSATEKYNVENKKIRLLTVKIFGPSGRGITLVFLNPKAFGVTKYQVKPRQRDVKDTGVGKLRLSTQVAVYCGNGMK